MTLLVVVNTRYRSAASIGNISTIFNMRDETIAQKAFPYITYSQSGVRNRLIKRTITNLAQMHLPKETFVHL